MAKGVKNLWSARRRRALQLAETLVASTADTLPVDLQQISARRAVRRIEFAPLLTDGGLAVRGDGFIIYVRCGQGNAADLNSQFAGDGTGITLPAQIVRRARFTIAHEIAHTFFYDTATTPPRPTVQIDDPTSATKLELACNQIAGLILLPETLLEHWFATSDFVRPKEFRELADAAAVSTQTVVHRFKHLRKLVHPEIIVASVTQERGAWIIGAISRHYSLRHIFIDAKVGARIYALVDEPSFVLCGGAMEKTCVTYVGHGGVRKMQFVCEGPTHSSSGRSLLVVGRPLP
jgi:hypothetical protein